MIQGCAVPRSRPVRLERIAGIGVDRMGALADAGGRDLLRLENLDTDVTSPRGGPGRILVAHGGDLF